MASSSSSMRLSSILLTLMVAAFVIQLADVNADGNNGKMFILRKSRPSPAPPMPHSPIHFKSPPPAPLQPPPPPPSPF